MLCHPFPPSGGAGVQRSTKFVKYLPGYGWRPTVLTVRDGVYAQRDESLLADLPPAARVIRTGTFEPPEATVAALRPSGVGPPGRRSRAIARALYDAAVIPDRALLWLPRALPAALQAAARARPEVIYATGNPYSSFLLASLLGRLLHRPYLLDFRDAWTLNPYSWRFREPLTPLRRWRAAVERRQEAAVLGSAAAAIFMSQQVWRDYAGAYPRLADRFTTIPNGFDPDDFDRVEPWPLEGFTILYAGKLMAYRRPDSFLRGFARARQADPAFAHEARALFLGDWRAEHQVVADGLGLGESVVGLGYRPHGEAIAYMKGSSALALIGGGDTTEQPGKVFEYLAADRPILALVPPDGASGEAVRASVAGGYFAPTEDPAAIAEALLRIWRDRDLRGEVDRAGREQFDRRRLTGRLADLLDRVASAGRP